MDKSDPTGIFHFNHHFGRRLPLEMDSRTSQAASSRGTFQGSQLEQMFGTHSLTTIVAAVAIPEVLDDAECELL
jgi:hypothetical protein